MNQDRPRLAAAYTVTALGVSGVSLLAPVLPELAARYGVAAGAMSVFQTAVMAPGIITAVLAGGIGARRGLRGILTVLLLVYGLAGTSLMLVSDFPTAIALRLVQGAGSGGLVAISFMLIGTIDPSRRIRATGYNAAVISTMMVVQPLIGSVLGSYSAVAPFSFYALSAVAALIVPRAAPTRPHRKFAHRSQTSGPPPIVRSVLVMNVLLNLVFFGWLLLLTPFLLDAAGVDLSVRGWALALQSGVATFVTLGTARWRERGHFRPLLIVGWSALAGVLAVAAAGPITLAAALLVVAGVYYGAVNPVLVSVVSGVDGGRWLGWWQSSSRLGQMAGPLVAGVLYAALPTRGVLLIGAAIGLATAGIVWIRFPARPS